MTPLQYRSLSIPVQEITQVGATRRAVAQLSEQLKFTDTDAGRAGIIVSELSQNLVKHAGGGEIVLRPLIEDRVTGLEILSIDKGPGFELQKCFNDGYSTSGTAGTGLGSVRRLSSQFDVISGSNGSVLMARIWPKAASSQQPAFDVGAVCVPIRTEEYCGDGWACCKVGDKYKIFVVDGLGHGLAANEAALPAIQVFEQNCAATPVSILESVHTALRATRGAAVAIAEMERDRQVVFAGIGNIGGTAIDGGAKRNFVSQPGTAGVEIHRVQDFVYPLSDKGFCVLYSDGLMNRFQFDNYPGLMARRASVIAGVLYRDYQRGRDDVTVIVVKTT